MDADQLHTLHQCLLDISRAVNAPRRDNPIARAAGLSGRTTLPLLVAVDSLGPIGLVDLADRLGREYTSVGRQVSKLETMGLLHRRHAQDRRVRLTAITSKGKLIIERVEEARQLIGSSIFASWRVDEIEIFLRLLRRFAEAISKER